LSQQYAARQILITQGVFTGEQLRKLIDQAQRNIFEVRVLPSYRQLIDGNLVVQPQPLSIEDLLQRKPVNWILRTSGNGSMEVVLVTGSAGSIGSEICRQLLQFSPRRIVAVDRSETDFFLEHNLKPHLEGVQIDLIVADVLDQSRISDILHQYRPQVIFHAAAYKHVPLMENHPGEAVKNIVTATRRLAELAMESGASSFVMISTTRP